MIATIIQPGYKSGRLTVIGLHSTSDPKKLSQHFHECVCECGTRTVLRRQELLIRRITGCRHCPKGVTHGMSKRPEYRAWADMKQRCSPEFHQSRDYSERGISVCPQWEQFESFFQDVGKMPTPQHTLERVDNNKGYEPGNVRWATRTEQMRNTRRNVWLTFDGRSMCLQDWATHLGIKSCSLIKRLKKWSLDRALSEPAHVECRRSA